MINAISFTCKPLAVDSAYYPRLSALETGLQRLCPLASAWRMDALLSALLSQQVRAKAGMRTKPSVVIIDFQSVKTTQKGQRGYGAGKRSKAEGAAAGCSGALGWHSGLGWESSWRRAFARLSQSRRLGKNDEVTVLFSRSIREDRLHWAHDQASGMTLRLGSEQLLGGPPWRGPRFWRRPEAARSMTRVPSPTSNH